ncbi:MAG TPA: AAA family ATPase [Burkholderiaceae bacterium]|nr:AAA family ATPase [Burkholderiaceae bacterium]
MKIKLLCNDSTRLETLRQAMLAADDGLEVIGSVGSPDSLPAFINGSMPDVVVLDGASTPGLEAIEALALRRPGLNAVVISKDASPEFLLQAMRAGVREVVPAASPPEVLQAALARVKQMRGMAAGAEDGKVYAFISCKGGSGATFLATNLAYALAATQNKRVALIDLNLQFGDAALYVSEQRASSHIAEVAQQIHRLDASLLHSAMLQVLPNFSVLAAPDDPAHATDVKGSHVDAIIKLARRHFDAVILDVPRTLDTVSLRALDGADTIFPVLQLTLPFVRDAKRLLDVFRSLEYPRKKIQFIVNRYEKGGAIALGDLEKMLGQPAFRTVPNSYSAVAASVNLGVPIVKAQRGNAVSKVLVEAARELLPASQPAAASGWLSRVLAR